MPSLHKSEMSGTLRQATFQQLRPICSVLLQHRTSPEQLLSGLTNLHSQLGSIDAKGLKGCWDYVMFPLMLIVDSIGPIRSQHKGTGLSPADLDGGNHVDVPVPAARSDRVAEAALGCLQLMLERCECTDLDQRMEIMQRMMPMLVMLTQKDKGSPKRGSEKVMSLMHEELTVLVLDCIGALFPAHNDESDKAIVMKGVEVVDMLVGDSVVVPGSSDPPAAVDSVVVPGSSDPPAAVDSVVVPGSSDPPAAEAFLPAAGFMIHTCLEVAESQLLSTKASPKVRLSALRALKSVVEGLGAGGDRLAFFLPGLASGLAKHLMPSASGSWTGQGAATGTGINSACLVSALQCLMYAVHTTLGDDHALLLLHRDHLVQPHGVNPQEQIIPLLQGKEEPLYTASTRNAGSTKERSLQVERTSSWIRESGHRISGLLARVLPPLCTHPNTTVRRVVAEGAVRLLQCCCSGGSSSALGESGSRLMLETVLTLSLDDWRQVQQPCLQFMDGRSKGELASSDNLDGSVTSFQKLLEDLLSDLPKAVRRGEEKALIASRRLAGAMMMAGE
ncbi:hypothetical protein CEUSTIGMA_g10605.t1 [Chlamydomonas eustigma]|uniref:TTI1 N-terminal TPR domain-containing protein n=1 Tax=Chlamydomonas eustigma TaxID=1157962 RepID=A0A250XJS8_9CHLO|nr:hypothetical protein CEUSTIGMA_g10605.t1 [Chlamydomonas eustigma]|eukprot:GAX83179.1 hypothetical protein CEUSTIGMA_g10605.t1 [Chlamydomonas eustigma]